MLPQQSSGKSVITNWHTEIYDKFRPSNNISSNVNEGSTDLQRFILESLRNFAEIRKLVSQTSIRNPLGFINPIPTLNLRFGSYGTPLGFKGHICGFLDIFTLTLGFFRLTINGVKRYFVY